MRNANSLCINELCDFRRFLITLLYIIGHY